MKFLIKLFLPMMATSLIAGTILAILGPLGTSRMPLSGRLIYWVGLCLAGGFGAGMVDLVAERLNRTLNFWQGVLSQSAGATLCVSAFMFLLYPPYNWQNVVMTILYVWLISIILCFVGALVHKRRAEAQIQERAGRPPLLERLPPKLRGAEIYAISAEDHYVRVHSSAGDEMILMRLSDAVKEAAPLLGVQTHRSWWVAEKGIEAVKKANGKIELVLKNGLTAPVSRSGRAQVSEAGWI